MKTFLVVTALLFSFTSYAQYFYKDIIGTKESADLIATYKNNKVRTVQVNSYTINNTPLNLSIQQEFLPQLQALRTITKTEYTDASYLTSYIDAAGRVTKTTDSTSAMVNTTLYTYNNAGQLTAVVFTAGDTLTAVRTDDHIWQYDAQNRISKMLRIKNKKDTAIVSFKLDESGNVIEEQEKRRALTNPSYYYYYDKTNRLSDIVRYNENAGRLLPEMMLEYSEKNQVIQRITVPQNSDNYLIWRMAYDAKGLKTKEIIFNKQKEQTGKVEYIYSFSN